MAYDGKIKKIGDHRWECAYWRPAVTVDIVLFGYGVSDKGEKVKRLQVLLIQRGNEPFKGQWALPGGFVAEEDQTLEIAARRELEEETNVKKCDPFLEEFGVYSEKDRDPRDRVISVAFMGMVRTGDFDVVGGSDASNAQWFTVEEILNKIENANQSNEKKEVGERQPVKKGWLAFDHDIIFQAALNKLKRDMYLRPIGLNLLDEEFTIPQLYDLYFSILYPNKVDLSSEEKVKLIDRSNFFKKMTSLGYIESADDKNEEVQKEKLMKTKRLGHKWPSWYRINKEKYRKQENKDVTENGIQLVFNSRSKK